MYRLLLSQNTNNQLVTDINFADMLKLSAGNLLIITPEVYRFMGQPLPDRETVVVGAPEVGMTGFATLREALDHADAHRYPDAVLVGFDRGFIHRALQHVDIVHLTILKPEFGDAGETAPDFQNDPQWRFTHGAINPIKAPADRLFTRELEHRLYVRS